MNFDNNKVPVIGTAVMKNPFWVERLYKSIDFPVENFVIFNNNGKNEYLFIDINNWGQYGKDTSHLPRYKAFTYGYTLVETELL